MKRRKAKQQPSQKEMLTELMADIREKDKERVIFFRQIGEIADRYAWKGIHGNHNGNHTKKARPPACKIPTKPSVNFLGIENKSMVPFPPLWMDAILKVSLKLLVNIY